MPAVLDSYALVALLFAARGHQRVLDLVEAAAGAHETLAIAAPNWVEVRYISERRAGARRWAEARERLLGFPLDIVPAPSMRRLGYTVGQAAPAPGLAALGGLARAFSPPRPAKPERRPVRATP
jgi:predicted nucleic acid-binding protein